ncbi:MAG TPA: winged helix DNA-binding domain-containing protein [Puia sp.]|nr:winged helix DNA-binding domain-containing protein [Puia sp.]
MNSQDITHRRLVNQQMAGEGFTEPAGLIQWMGCIRAGDFTAAKWAIGNRVAGSTDKTIEEAFNQGEILRTHILQPEWHFISPADIRWMLTLTSPKLRSFNKDIYRTLGIDASILKKSKRVIARALEKGQLTRVQLRKALEKERIHTDDLRLGWLLMDAELDGLICSGGMEGHQFTYALLDQRAPAIQPGEKEAHLAELTRRYFLSRGPATVHDFAEWSGLRTTDIGIGMELNRAWLAREVVDGQVYWFDPSGVADDHHPSLLLLPALDEWAMAYSGNSFFKPMLIIDGQVSGTWTASSGKGRMTINVITPVRMDGALEEAIRREIKRYSSFLGRGEIVLTLD